MDYNRVDRQFNKRIRELSKSMAAESNAEPLEIYDREFFFHQVAYEDAEVMAQVFICSEYLDDKADIAKENPVLLAYGPWIVFKVGDVLQGDPEAKIEIGSIILAKWNPKLKTYNHFLVEAEPRHKSKVLGVISTLLPLTVDEMLKA